MQAEAAESVKVTPETFIRAETDKYFFNVSQQAGGINKLQDQFVIQAKSADPFPKPKWDQQSLDALRAKYEKEFQTFAKYPSDWQGPRGKVNEKTRHLAAAGAWGLFPEWDATPTSATAAITTPTCATPPPTPCRRTRPSGPSRCTARTAT